MKLRTVPFILLCKINAIIGFWRQYFFNIVIHVSRFMWRQKANLTPSLSWCITIPCTRTDWSHSCCTLHQSTTSQLCSPSVQVGYPVTVHNTHPSQPSLRSFWHFRLQVSQIKRVNRFLFFLKPLRLCGVLTTACTRQFVKCCQLFSWSCGHGTSLFFYVCKRFTI